MPDLTVLIPLDGTTLSEQALSAMPLLRGIGVTKVRLVGVGEVAWENPGQDAPKELTETAERGRSVMESYLRERAERVTAFGMEASHSARVGRVADEILEEASEGGADIIAIATHGRTGVARFRLGSVADRVVRGASVPTLVIGPNVEVKLDPFEVRRILVPLDGTDLGEDALLVARLIASRTGAGIDLVRIVSIPTMSIEPAGGYSVDLIESMQKAAEIYLERMAEELKPDISVTTTAMMGNVSEDLLAYLEQNPADLVVMSSHGRGGVTRWLLGSITDRMLHGPAPVLVLRPEQESRLLDDARGGK